MPQSDAARTTGKVAEDRDPLRCSRLLVDTATANVVSLSAAPSVLAALPEFFASLARALHYDRAYILEIPHALLFDWTASEATRPPSAGSAPVPQDDLPEIAEWMLPLARGEAVITQRHSA